MKNTNADRIMQEVGKVILGKDECIRQVMTAILAGGHVLIEDIPGVGKTSMALAFAKAMSLKQNRVQFTPDVLRYYRIFHVHKRNRKIHVSAGSCDVQPVSGR